MSTNWASIEPALIQLYDDLGKLKFVNEDIQYLKKALKEVEYIWDDILARTPSPKFVLLAEAPLYGETKSYFYNPSAGATSFFNYKNAEDIVGPINSNSKLQNGIRKRKVEMIDRLCTAGFIILDLFPFCFDHKLTHVNYREIEHAKLYHQLFNNITTSYLGPKLDQLIIKNPNISFGFRYANLHKIVGHDFNNLVNTKLSYQLEGIHSFHKNRDLNSKAVKAEMVKAQ